MEMSDPSEQLNHQGLYFACRMRSCYELEGQITDMHHTTQTSHILLQTKSCSIFSELHKDGRKLEGHLTTWQERLLHGFHQTLQVVFDIVHDDVDLIHIASHNYFLILWG